MDIRKKFGLAMVAFAGLGILSWLTLSDDPIMLHPAGLGFDVHVHFRTATLAVLGLLAVLTSLSFWRGIAEERREGGVRRD